MVDHRGERYARSLVDGVTVDAEADGREGDRPRGQLIGQSQAGAIGASQQVSLVAVAPALRARLGTSGSLVAAGIVRDALPDVLAAFSRVGLAVVQREERDDWIRLILTA